MTDFLQGNKKAEHIIDDISRRISVLGRKPLLVGVCILSSNAAVNEAALAFLAIKKRAGEKAGMRAEIVELDGALPPWTLRRTIRAIAMREDVDGVLVQLPTHFSANAQQYIMNAIPPEKDPDVLTQRHLGSFFVGRSVILPPCVDAVREVLLEVMPNLKGIRALIVGYGTLTGRPIAHWLASHEATISVINKYTTDGSSFGVSADLIITAAGKPNLVTESWIKPGAVVLDFGYGRDSDGIMKGDSALATDSAAALVSPVPGGMGPIMVACLLRNTVILADRRKKPRMTKTLHA